MAIGQRLAKILSDRGLSPMDLVEKTGFSHTTVYNWIKGAQEPTAKNRDAICKALNIAESELFEGGRQVTTQPDSFWFVLQHLGYTPDDLTILTTDDWRIIRSVLEPLIQTTLERRGVSPRTAPSAAPAREPASKYIFIVDDEIRMCHIMASALQERGFVTDYAFNGRAALDRLLKRKDQPDLILLDLHMPGMDGYEFLRQIRHVSSDTKVIVVTGHPSDLADLHAADLKIEGFFEKPFIVKDIVDKAEELLQ
jgi:CheY-like chemotaxis protein/transcriptional regulator with XRE-family HTH domain